MMSNDHVETIVPGPPTTGLAAFDGVLRGDLAPRWVRDGIVGAWGLAPDAEVRLIVLSENVTFRVDLAGVPRLVVRLGRPGYATSAAHVRSELEWVEALRRDIDIDTPAPVRGIDDGFVQQVVDGVGGAWSAVAFDFVSGVILEDQTDFAGRFLEIGRITARLHEHARGWARPIGFRRFGWHLDDLVGTGARWGDWRRASLADGERRLLERAESGARAVLDEVGVTADDPQHFGLIHGDLRPSNVMSDGDRLTIIDFDDCGFGYYLYDFGAALTFYEHRPDAAAMAAAWFDGYHGVNPMRHGDADAAVALSMLRRLTMLGWATTHRADALPTDLWEENQPGTLEVAARYLADRRWLLSEA